MALTPEQIDRYARHLTLREIGGAGQNALLAARVAIVGAGGLGGPAGLYLTAAGVGHITLIDDDVVEASNLQRQIQFAPGEIGAGKAEAMGKQLEALNSDCKVTSIAQRLTAENAADLLENHDVILDGTDSFTALHNATRLVCFDDYDLIVDAIQREKTMKGWPRQWKINLIERTNPDWLPLHPVTGEFQRI